MHLYFDEMILASSFRANGLMLESLDHSCFNYSTQGRMESSCNSLDWSVYQSWTFSRPQTLYVGVDSSELVFRLSEYDLNGIKVIENDLYTSMFMSLNENNASYLLPRLKID